MQFYFDFFATGGLRVVIFLLSVPLVIRNSLYAILPPPLGQYPLFLVSFLVLLPKGVFATTKYACLHLTHMTLH